MRVNELKAWHWIIMITARPRVQSRKGSRFTWKKWRGTTPLAYDIVRRVTLRVPAPEPAAFLRAGNTQSRTQGFGLGFGERLEAAQQLDHFRQAAEMIDA